VASEMGVDLGIQKHGHLVGIDIQLDVRGPGYLVAAFAEHCYVMCGVHTSMPMRLCHPA